MRASIAARMERLKKFCPLYVIGYPRMSPCSFPAAIKLPVNVKEPSITSTPITPTRTVPSAAPCR